MSDMLISSGRLISGGLLNTRHAVLRMRINIITQLVRCDSPVGNESNRYHVFRRRRFTLEGIQPLPHMPLLHVAAGHYAADGTRQRDLPANQLNRS